MCSSPGLTVLPLIALFLAACSGTTPTPQALASPISAEPSPTRLSVMPATYTPTPSPTPIPPTATPVPSLTPTPEPTIAATLITPFVKGHSLAAYDWSPDSRWLPYVDSEAQVLYFYDVARSTTCHMPVSFQEPDPDHFLAWLPDGRVVVQVGDQVMTGKPCWKFFPATEREALILDQQDSSYSPDGRYQVMAQPYKGNSKEVNTVIKLKDVASGENLVEIAFFGLSRDGNSLPGYWLDASNFLIPVTADQGPLLLNPKKPPVKLAADIFQLPLKPGSGIYDNWLARSAVTSNPPRFHLMLVGMAGLAVDNPLQIFHSETGRVETLPYFADQAAFTNDGHGLLVGEASGQVLSQALIRQLDPPGALLEPFTDRSDTVYMWSPDGKKAVGMSNKPDQQSFLVLYSSPQRMFLSAWRAPEYRLFPYWSPDGKYLAASARSLADPDQEAIFAIPMDSDEVEKP